MAYVVYMLRCSDNTLYTGIAKDLESRLQTHRTAQGSKYVRARLPFSLVYQEPAESKSAALKREYAIKQLSRAEKEMLVSGKQ